MPLTVALGCVAALLALATAAAMAGRSRGATPFVYGAALLITMIGAAAGLVQLLGHDGHVPRLVLPVGLPWLGAHVGLDALSAFFLFVINLGGAASSLFALGYGRHETAPARVLPFFPAFLGAMNFVVMAEDAFSFLVSWEFMSLTSWALVMAHHRERGNAHAGYVYLLMAGFGTLCLLLGFGLLAGANGGYDFATMRAGAHATGTAALVLGLVLLGAGSKAGLVPLHAWLPLAHPAAPSHVSALMSGVMTKVAVYGFLRIVFDLLGPPSWWSGMAVLAIGGITAALGVLYALMQQDLKRLLAYSTVENIGIVFIGIGLALSFRANGMAGVAALALTAALFHVLNHALFKSLLFFGSGAVLTETGERDMERLGGLIRRMPVTAFAFLVGCVAISALPPVNGFVSEWLTFQAILLSPDLPQWGLKISIPAVGALLALAAALAAACFVKAFGVVFLGRARTAAAATAAETDRFSLAAMLLCATLCVAAGVFPGLVIDALAAAVNLLVQDRMPEQANIAWLSIVPIAASRSSYSGLVLCFFILVSTWISVLAIHRAASRRTRRAPAWDCGFPDPSPATQYGSASFAQPIRRVFGTLLFQARERVEMPPPGDGRPARLHLQIRDLIWDTLYAPVSSAVALAADRLNHLQFLTIRRYLSLVFGALIFLLLVIAVWL